MAQFVKTKVSPEHLTSVAAGIDEHISILQNCVARLDDIMARLDAGWDGEANAQFMANYRVDKEFFEKFLVAHRQLNDTLKQGSGNYRQADASAVSQVHALPKAR